MNPDPGGARPPACAPTDDAGDGGGLAGGAWFWFVFAVALGLALAFRLTALDARPMHHDEANQAIRFGQLLETGQYRYDPAEHHGPTLYYLTLPAAWLRGQPDTASLDEWTVRLVPAAFGVATVLLLLLLVRDVGRTAVVVAAALVAVAPPLTYYARFYIQESLLLFFSLGFLLTAGRYAWRPRRGDAVWAGAFAGLALATKETAVILLPAALGACLVARRLTPGEYSFGRNFSSCTRPPGSRSNSSREDFTGRALDAPRPAEHLWLAAAVAVGIAAAFYSSLFTNLPGLAELFRAPGIYFGRGLAPDAHRQPWHYYLGLVTQTSGGARLGIDAGLGVLVVAAVRTAVARDSWAGPAFWARMLLVYAVFTTVVFSALPYKTPWNVLPFYAAWLALAAVGATEPIERGPWHVSRLALVAALGLCLILAVQSWRANFRYPSDPRNPYAYAQTSPDVVRLAGRARALSMLHADRDRMLVAVIAAPAEQWPLPWYFRRLARVGYWPTAASAAEALRLAPLVIASPEQAGAVQAALGDRYQSEIYGLRPGILMSVFIERSLWDRFIDSVK